MSMSRDWLRILNFDIFLAGEGVVVPQSGKNKAQQQNRRPSTYVGSLKIDETKIREVFRVREISEFTSLTKCLFRHISPKSVLR